MQKIRDIKARHEAKKQQVKEEAEQALLGEQTKKQQGKEQAQQVLREEQAKKQQVLREQQAAEAAACKEKEDNIYSKYCKDIGRMAAIGFHYELASEKSSDNDVKFRCLYEEALFEASSIRHDQERALREARDQDKINFWSCVRRKWFEEIGDKEEDVWKYVDLAVWYTLQSRLEHDDAFHRFLRSVDKSAEEFMVMMKASIREKDAQEAGLPKVQG